MARLTLNDLQRQGLLDADGATADDIISATTAGGIRIMGVLISHTAANGVCQIQDAATFSAADFVVRCVAEDSQYHSFAPHGWRVSNVSTSTTGDARIFYILDE